MEETRRSRASHLRCHRRHAKESRRTIPCFLAAARVPGSASCGKREQRAVASARNQPYPSSMHGVEPTTSEPWDGSRASNMRSWTNSKTRRNFYYSGRRCTSPALDWPITSAITVSNRTAGPANRARRTIKRAVSQEQSATQYGGRYDAPGVRSRGRSRSLKRERSRAAAAQKPETP
jgi:hypothetical protein